MDLRKIMQEAQRVQQKMEEAEEALADERVEGTAGGGAVKVVLTGQRNIVEVKIDKAAVDPADVESLEAMVFVAFKSATEKADQLREQKMSGLGVPNMPFGR